MARTILGLLPEIRGGLGALARAGQHSRFIDGYLKPYARAFDEIRYFSYLTESLADYTDDADVRASVRLLAGSRWHPWAYAVAMPVRYQREIRGCSVLRVFQVTGVVPALLAKWRYGIPFVTTYGFPSRTLRRSWLSGSLRARVEAQGLRYADAVIVPTAELRTDIERRVGNPAGIHLIPNGVDIGRFAPGATTQPGRAGVLYVGRLSPEKNLETLIAAAAKLGSRLEARLTFVGDGPLRERLRRAATEHGVRLELVPSVDHRELPRIYGSADVFVLPSFTEGHSKVLIEAMSCGLPCIASDIVANRSVLADGDAGLLFDPHDAGALAARLEQVYGQRRLADELGQRARGRVLAHYDLATLVAREIELLQRVAGARASAPKLR
jgi:glycosyltransferase involved in cell wall biosynthesis